MGWEERAVERWFRKRRNQYKAGGLKKFRESWWKFVYYILLWSFGVYILYDVRLLFSFLFSSLCISQYERTNFSHCKGWLIY